MVEITNPAERRFLLASVLERLFGRKEVKRIRLSPLKVLLYLESRQRHKRASSPDGLGREIGIGGYDTITDSFVWLIDHKYIAAASGVRAPAAELRDPNEFVITPLGKNALKPYLGTYSSKEVVGVATSTMVLGLGLGTLLMEFQSYPSFLWFIVVIGLMLAASMALAITVVMMIGRDRNKKRATLLMESVVDRG